MFIKVELNNNKNILPNYEDMPLELIMEKRDLQFLDIGSAFIETLKLYVEG